MKALSTKIGLRLTVQCFNQ